jgi:putative phosphoserine phosphatase / 1-acylglycerol-3-phosphate O-acyltransferase
MVMIMPQGTIPRARRSSTPSSGRWGAARLAQMSGAPVIPVGLWGTEQVWPRSSRLPNVLNLASPPTVRVRVGPAVALKGRSLEADTKRIMAAIVDLLPEGAYTRRRPSTEELARTFPPGYDGDPTKEVGRRPGTDR